MDTLTIIGLGIAFVVLATLATALPVTLRAARTRNAHFKAIADRWLKCLNDEAAIFNKQVGGNPFCEKQGGKIKVRISGAGWIIAVPLVKRYSAWGFKVDVYMIIYIDSLIPNKDGAILTTFVSLTEPVKKWWSSQHRDIVFPILATRLHAKKLEFTFAPTLVNTLIPKETTS